MKEYSAYQQKIISRFYDNRDQLDESRLSELVTSLYLGKPGKQMDKQWLAAQEAMERLKIPASRIAHVMEKRDPAVLAEVVKDLANGVIKRS